MIDNAKGFWIQLALLGIVAVIGIGIWLIQASNEAATFNKFKQESQPEATIWDALFAELRVDTQN